ncbi:MAG TPA: hypothetical protein ENN69_09005, partial [Spirochaetia bacterium]|nr:hypothetical protein [Spirochaetia bacterium]
MRFLPLVGALIGNVLHVRLPRRGIGRGGGRFFLTGFVTLFIVVFLVFFFRFLLALYGNLVIAGSFIRYPRPFPEIVFFTAFLVNLILLFFAAIPPATALFLKRKENEFFLNLPLSPVRMALARYTALFSVIFPLNLFLSLPAVFSYSRYYAFGLEFLPGLSAGLVVLPQIAVVLAVMFVVALRKLPRFSGFRPAAEIGVFVILFALLAAMQLVLQHALIDLGRDHGNIFLLELADFLSGTAEAVPPLKWAALSFTADDGWRSFLLFLLVGGALSAL